MPRSYKGHKYILCSIDKAMNYLITVLIHQSRSEKNRQCPNRKCNFKILCTWLHDYGPRYCIYVFTHELFAQEFDIKIKTVATHNHQLLQAEQELSHCLQSGLNI